MILVSLKDIKLGVYSAPIPYNNETEVKRAMQSRFAQYPYASLTINADQFEVWKLAEFKEQDGNIKITEELIITNKELKTMTDQMLEYHEKIEVRDEIIQQ